MKIFVKVKPKSREEKVEEIDRNYLKIWVKEPAIKGRANKALIDVLSRYFSVSPSRINIISGLKSRDKIINIDIL